MTGPCENTRRGSDKGYHAKAAEWRTKLAEWQTSTQPATQPSPSPAAP